MSNLSISKAWDETRGVLVRDGKLIANLAGGLILLPQAVVGVVAPSPALSGEEAASWVPLLSLLVALIGIVGQIALMRLAIGPATTVGEAIVHGFRRLLPAFAALLLFAIPLALILVVVLAAMAGPDSLAAVMAGRIEPRFIGAILLFVVIAILFSVRFQMIVPVATAEPVGPLKILRRSFELTSGHYWRLLAVLLLACVVAVILLLFAQLLGGILARVLIGDIKPFSVGALLVALISATVQAAFSATLSVMLARIYVQLSGRKTSSAPKSGI